jgi:hypothetical protein
MTHPPSWNHEEPCPTCGSWDILECDISISGEQVRMGWECRDCGHAVTWTTRLGDDKGHAVERRLVAVMPLHAITTLYGERGLRERFADETARLTDSKDRRKVKQALQLAGRLHALDHRQREPYLNHVLRVALRIMCHYGVTDADVICAALLHDTVEDHTKDLSAHGGRDGAFAVLTVTFGARVADLVAAVTNPDNATDDHYRAHLEASLGLNPWARVIKASDFTDNGVGVHYTTGHKAARLARKYAPVVPTLVHLIARPDTPLNCKVKARILGQLHDAEQRFASIAQLSTEEGD